MVVSVKTMRCVSRVLIVLAGFSLCCMHVEAQKCTNVKPPGRFTCAQQEAFGACTRDWMIEGDYCARECGRCEGGCEDVEVPGFFSASCSARKARGECEDLVTDGYCKDTCGGCGVLQVTTPIPKPAEEANSMTPASDEDLTPEEMAYREELAAAVENLNTENSDVTVLPELALPEGIPAVDTTPVRVSGPKKSPCNVTALDALEDDPALSTTVAAIEALGLEEAFSRDDISFTLFAPTNAAWKRVAKELGTTVSDILAAQRSLKNVLFNHVIPNINADASELASLLSENSQSGGLLFFGRDDSGKLRVVGAGSSAKVIEPDLAVGCDYVIHKIGNVLLPASNSINPEFQQALKTGKL